METRQLRRHWLPSGLSLCFLTNCISQPHIGRRVMPVWTLLEADFDLSSLPIPVTCWSSG